MSSFRYLRFGDFVFLEFGTDGLRGLGSGLGHGDGDTVGWRERFARAGRMQDQHAGLLQGFGDAATFEGGLDVVTADGRRPELGADDIEAGGEGAAASVGEGSTALPDFVG